MNITIVTPVFPPSVGGVQLHAMAFARGLSARGARVTVITSTCQEAFRWYNQGHEVTASRREEMKCGVRVIRSRPRFLPIWLMVDRLCMTKWRGVYRGLSCVLGSSLELFQGPWVYAYRQLLSSRPDVQIIMWPYFRAVRDVVTLKQRHGIPLVVVPIFHVGQEHVTRHLLGLLTRADWIPCSTTLECDIFVRAGVDRRRMDVLGCGVDGVEQEPRSPCTKKGPRVEAGGWHVGYLGRLDTAKGVLGLLMAARTFLAEDSSSTLTLMGATTATTPMVIAEVEALPVAERHRVRIVADFAESSKHDLLSSMDVLVLPSVAESFGIAVVEAWACRKPVVVCAETASACLVNECKGGLTYPHGDAQALVETMHRLRRDPQMASSMGEMGFRHVRARYTWDGIVDRLHGKCVSLAKKGYKTHEQVSCGVDNDQDLT